jgi:hypothetical protein
MNHREIKTGKKYIHFKGNEYLVLHVAKHSETLEDMVVYQALYGERGIWVRPLSMFLEKKEVDGKIINRFEEIKEKLELIEEIYHSIEMKYENLPFKNRGIKISKELIVTTVEILNNEPNKILPQNTRNASRENTPDGLDKNIKEALNTDLRTANIISDILQEVGIVEVIKVENKVSGRDIKGTRLLPEWCW